MLGDVVRVLVALLGTTFIGLAGATAFAVGRNARSESKLVISATILLAVQHAALGVTFIATAMLLRVVALAAAVVAVCAGIAIRVLARFDTER